MAPLALLAARSTLAALRAISVIGLLSVAYDFGVFGSFLLPSILFAVAPYFAVGIVSRIYWSRYFQAQAVRQS